MKRQLLGTMTAIALCAGALPALAADTDPEQCLECHEPSEDWTGMTLDEIVAKAKSPDIKRHADHDALSDEQLKLIITGLMPDLQ
jgi:hypothetical protein